MTREAIKFWRMKIFKEALNTAVFTTVYVVKKNSPILFVYHDEDGGWQFHGPEDNVAEQDMMIIGLGELIEIDNSVLEVSDIPVGSEAVRSSRGNQWRIITRN